MKKILTALCLTTILGMAGCGQTGSLYMPETPEEPQQSEKVQP